MIERRLVAIEGVVQGVGFRPFVHGLATTLELRGRVRNDRGGVLVDIEGEPHALEEFLRRLTSASPPLASIEAITVRPAPGAAYADFAIAGSTDQGRRDAVVAPDVATCDACLAELFDPADRRYRYPFISCAYCGPRFTIVNDVPYDRARTTMHRFPLCDACRREYADPADRRFHAQSTACARCGPALSALWLGRAGEAAIASGGALEVAIQALADGRIVAVKGLGGYHLACDATNDAAVCRLRARKHREAKPLAVMVRDLAAARARCCTDAAGEALLCSPARPIVLLPTRTPTDVAPTDSAPTDIAASDIAASVAPHSRHLGLMLPYTPLHHLLLAALDRPLVMTSGNVSDEPIVTRDDDARTRLGSIADLLLMHDRAIATRCDDSVVRVIRGAPSYLRRSRGLAPCPLTLAAPLRAPTLALGGHLKSTFCIGRERRAWLSHHIGDLESAEATLALQASVAQYRHLFDVVPDIIAHDLHPDYRSTRLAEAMPCAERVPVQHHLAHVASCLAEHRDTGAVLGVAFDGAGLGTDGAIWGGEFLLVERAGWERVAHLAYVPLPGGDAAAREPWRSAVAHLWAAFGGELDALEIPFFRYTDPARRSALARLLQHGMPFPSTSSAGRLFDAVAALIGVRQQSRFEGEAAMQLEAIAEPSTHRSYPMEIREAGRGWIVDPAPLVRQVVADTRGNCSAAEIAGAFHNALRDAIVAVAERVRQQGGIARVALTGGVFQNARLTECTVAALSARGFEVLRHRLVPCNDGGLALGQLAIAGAAALRESPCV